MKLWDVSTGVWGCLMTLVGHTGLVTWDFSTGECRQTLRTDRPKARSLQRLKG
ncbi:hypothetical protein [Nostoc sp. 'Lobaria pulmonaria (5183) cyanobiont']|uniref:hypothetical protein n=1 Tax=Nostoc sp. 'Lobaria pulmonaria (5183) cyanobiont' TaxID=1618022 RepID=UPI00131A2CD0|nr:hypothetical protein [Nostoc sp. 'Lobaria pulmonaria (5183) cyanobiont']